MYFQLTTTSSKSFFFNRFSNFLVYFSCVIFLSLSVLAAASNPSDHDVKSNPEQAFLTTSPVPSMLGPLHVEVQVFDIKNDDSLKKAQLEIKRRLEDSPNSIDFFRINIRTNDHISTELDLRAHDILTQFEKSIHSENMARPSEIIVPAPSSQNFIRQNYNLTLGFVRFIANSGVVSTGLILGFGVPVPQALLVGLLAGTMSGTLQIKNAEVFKWLSNSVLLVNAAKKFKLLPDDPNLRYERAEKVLREVEMYGRWAAIETGFLVVCQTAMLLLNIPITENLFAIVAKSTASQGIYELGILKFTDHLNQINPAWANRSANIKNVSLFLGSSISVLSAIGALVGLPFANLGFVVLGTAGLVLNFSPKLIKTQPVQNILSRWSGASTRATEVSRAVRSVIKPKLRPQLP